MLFIIIMSLGFVALLAFYYYDADSGGWDS
jgi:hypothetical protein